MISIEEMSELEIQQSIAKNIKLYSNSDVLVTSSSFKVGPKTYLLRNLSSATITKNKENKILPFLLFFIGVIAALLQSYILAGIIIACGIALFTLSNPKYYVRIITNDKDVDGFLTKDKSFAYKIVNSLNMAIVEKNMDKTPVKSVESSTSFLLSKEKDVTRSVWHRKKEMLKGLTGMIVNDNMSGISQKIAVAFGIPSESIDLVTLADLRQLENAIIDQDTSAYNVVMDRLNGNNLSVLQ